ncbi:disease resistance protein RPM1-like isoform X1 [Cornus florida]|uniref:disease resistance protein RPM1-like isoform X1 n=1 Tax=Cornus florida TaxID=4283 RepID=UPI002899DF1E|nr:disease resistance protein RPM1-like isoform X1 [Cornus florida]
MAEIAVSVALFFIEEVISYFDNKGNVGSDLQAEVRALGRWLRKAQAHLKDMEGAESNESLKEHMHQIRDLAYDIEDVLNEYMLCVQHRIHKHKFSNKAHGFFTSVIHRSLLNDVESKIKEIKRKIGEIGALDPIRANINVASAEEGSTSSSSVNVPPQLLEDEIIGFENPRKKLVHQLTRGGSSRSTISVVGPAGSGKTTLVKSVYESKEVRGHFDSHAWLRVSCFFKLEKLICSMLKQIGVPKELIPHEGVDVQAKVLRDHLQQKRYVLVLDDIWRKDDWERIKFVLPNGSSGSRIIVTTRNSDLASFCVESSDSVISLECLSWPEAWGLFCKKAFKTGRGKCPPELEELSQNIVKRCEGLPIAIVAVGCLLSNRPQVPNEWKKLHDSLGSEIGSNANLSIISRMLLPSYNLLPSNHKSCLLYFSIFPEDHSIECGRLIRLWIAEGFVMKERGKTLEEVAEEYLNELIGRNLVHVSKWDFDGRARSCRLQNLLLEFIVSKSEDENFVSILSEPNDSSSSEKVRRLSIHNAGTNLSWSTRFSWVRSTFFFRWDGLSPSHIGNVLCNFRYLRVLDLQDAPLEEFPEYVVDLSLLRYLSLRRTNIKTVPKSIKKLSHLQTLDLRQTYVTELPAKILQLQNLRNLLVYRYNVQNYVTLNSVEGVAMSAGIGGWTALQKLSLVKPDKQGKIIKELEALKQLRKLGLIDLKRKDGKNLCSSIQKMQSLLTLDLSSIRNESLDLDHMPSPPPHLQRLYLKGHLEKLPGWISSLHNLFRIVLKWSGLQGSPLGTLQDLANLVALELVDVTSGKELVFRAGKFRKLKILRIEQFHRLHTMIIEEGTMPELQKLTLCRCVELKILPLGINNLTHLKELLLYDMPKDFVAQLQKTSDDRDMVSHIPLIHSFTLGSNQLSFQNLS